MGWPTSIGWPTRGQVEREAQLKVQLLPKGAQLEGAILLHMEAQLKGHSFWKGQAIVSFSSLERAGHYGVGAPSWEVQATCPEQKKEEGAEPISRESIFASGPLEGGD